VSRGLKQTAAGILVVFAVAQLIRPNRANPPTDASRTIHTQLGTANGMAAILDRACGDCHSNNTVWPWYTEVAPVSWAMAYAVKEGRRAVNFSDWTAYPAERRRQLLVVSCQDVSGGKMPGSAWTWLHPEARLSAQDIKTICVAARQT
jgi:heme-binding protein